MSGDGGVFSQIEAENDDPENLIRFSPRMHGCSLCGRLQATATLTHKISHNSVFLCGNCFAEILQRGMMTQIAGVIMVAPMVTPKPKRSNREKNAPNN